MEEILTSDHRACTMYHSTSWIAIHTVYYTHVLWRREFSFCWFIFDVDGACRYRWLRQDASLPRTVTAPPGFIYTIYKLHKAQQCILVSFEKKGKHLRGRIELHVAQKLVDTWWHVIDKRKLEWTPAIAEVLLLMVMTVKKELEWIPTLNWGNASVLGYQNTI